MAAGNKPEANSGDNSKRKQRYLPHNKQVKKKGSYPLRPGVVGFFITCDGGREYQASREAINVIDTFYEELVGEDYLGAKHIMMPNKRLNKITKFSDSEASSDDDESKTQKEKGLNHENKKNYSEETPIKKQRLETSAIKSDNVITNEIEGRSIDKLIEAELKELGDRSKRHFLNLDAGCNGVVFVQMVKRDGDPGPSEIVHHMMTSSASTRKHISRFILRVLPVELTCYASEEEISKAITPLITRYFPEDAQTPLKFAVLLESRANTGIDKMSIINSVAKAVCGPYKVDLNHPDKTIIVQICKTVCLIGVVEKYKELCKYNLRQLTA